MEGQVATGMAPEIWAVIIVAIIGVIGTLAAGLGAPIIQHYLQGRRQHKINNTRKILLKKILKDVSGTGWMHINQLAQIVGADLETTRMLLIEIEARGSMLTKKETWSLISRNPLPTKSSE